MWKANGAELYSQIFNCIFQVGRVKKADSQADNKNILILILTVKVIKLYGQLYLNDIVSLVSITLIDGASISHGKYFFKLDPGSGELCLANSFLKDRVFCNN